MLTPGPFPPLPVGSPGSLLDVLILSTAAGFITLIMLSSCLWAGRAARRSIVFTVLKELDEFLADPEAPLRREFEALEQETQERSQRIFTREQLEHQELPLPLFLQQQKTSSSPPG